MINHPNKYLSYFNNKYPYNKHKFNSHQYNNKFLTSRIYIISHHNSKHQVWLQQASHQWLINKTILINILNSIHNRWLHNIINNLDFNNNNFPIKDNLVFIPLISIHNQIFINHLKLILQHIMLMHHVIIINKYRIKCKSINWCLCWFSFISSIIKAKNRIKSSWYYLKKINNKYIKKNNNHDL